LFKKENNWNSIHPSKEQRVKKLRYFRRKTSGTPDLSSNSFSFLSETFQRTYINIADIQTLEDLQKIPTTVKNDIQQNNDDFFCITPDKIVDYSTTSGTLGDPVTFGLSDNDLERLPTTKPFLLPVQGFRKEMLYR
jgi:phenylacetate-CoA ligase